jgi:hypothetical protein
MLFRALVSACVVLVLFLLPSAAARGQTMQEKLSELFVFGGGEDPLFLVGTAGQEATEVHGAHFIPASSQANAAVLDFFNAAIASNIANIPLSSTVSSQTFRIVDGVPTPTSNSFGPIFAERAQTIGRGRLKAGVNYSRLRFSSVRGIPLDQVKLNFVHQNSDFPGCDTIFGADCTLYGVPQFENDLMTLSLDLNMDADVFAFFGTFGVTDWLDLSFAVPIVDFQLRGSSVGTMTPSTDPAFHFFGGTQDDPGLTANSQTFGQTTGLGDIAMRLKALLVSGENWDLGLLADARAPTGDEENFLGTGEWNVGGLLIISGQFSDFSPHANVGYEYRGGKLEQDQVELITGFDQKLADWATLAVDLLAAFKVGNQQLVFPQPVTYESPFVRAVEVTNIPNTRDDIIDGSLGFKFQTGAGLIIITNVLVPLNDGGLRSGVTPTIGLEYTI